MADEAKLNVATGFNGGVSVSVRADSPSELATQLDAIAATAANNPTLAGLFQPLLGQASLPVAAQVVQAAFPSASPVSTVGAQAVAQPGGDTWSKPPTQPAFTPPLIGDGGNCAHGPRIYKDTMAKGKPWRRWECSIPWSREAVGRCANVNA